ncbi:hypothetical protein NLU13_1725 [Sarocladium strictum]|uniref:Ribonucleases P/MRP subunit Pop8-like domain-containing protein n=1 Tax=Sarocladium strictum TaxID=5046 RepID=A0AA39GRH4_SARSR|nr:hypothetical protein NLU13_1725 [Sarocladium strictum]
MSAQADMSISKAKGFNKSIDILTCTIRAPPFSYVHLEVVSADPTSNNQDSNLDELQVKSYCSAACRQFLGLTGAAIPIDILKVDGMDCWLRLPRQDLGSFSAAVTTWKGTTDEKGERVVLRVKQCSDWLGMMVGTEQQAKLWGP